MAAKSVIILQDCIGLPSRAAVLRSVHGFVRPVVPDHCSHAHAKAFPEPIDWLPANDDPLPRKCWWKADALGLAAVQHFGYDADFYWFIESDVAATPETWKSLFRHYEDNGSDCIATMIGRRSSQSAFRHWDHPGTPADAQRHFLMACYRLSKRAVEASIQLAGTLRETFSEVAVPLVMRRSGFVMESMDGRFCDSSTVSAFPDQITWSNRMLNHPVKSDAVSP